VGLKDIIFTAGVETAAGSKVLAGFVPEYDATVTARLKAAGAIILGKTVTTEFAMFEPGPTRNPWNPEHTPGGSSSGSAAAVAARMCPAAFGSQTAGSILRPAAFCGIVGLKPTYGRVSRHGVVPVSWTLDHVGPMVRTVADAALLLKVVAGPDPNDPTTLPVPVDDYPAAVGQDAAGLRVGIPDRFFTEAADDESRRAYEAAVTRLKELGLMLRPVRLPGVFEPLRDAHRTIMYAEAATFHKKWFAERPDDYRPPGPAGSFRPGC
jgi:aspartyl-tRNA(Asn)/glutamyl-tRNA(Gln) amidotransferase subunit A